MSVWRDLINVILTLTAVIQLVAMTASVVSAFQEVVATVVMRMNARKEQTTAMLTWRIASTQLEHFCVNAMSDIEAMEYNAVISMNVERDHIIAMGMHHAATLWAVLLALVTPAFRAMVSVVKM